MQVQNHSIFLSCFLPPSVSIQGADNVGEMTLKVVPGEPLNYHWKGHGLRLHIPADALDPSTPPLIMRIQASLSGQFKLPDDMDLVSGVYWIYFPAGVLKKPVTLELQHCAYLEQTELDLPLLCHFQMQPTTSLPVQTTPWRSLHHQQ